MCLSQVSKPVLPAPAELGAALGSLQSATPSRTLQAAVERKTPRAAGAGGVETGSDENVSRFLFSHSLVFALFCTRKSFLILCKSHVRHRWSQKIVPDGSTFLKRLAGPACTCALVARDTFCALTPLVPLGVDVDFEVGLNACSRGTT